MKEDLIKISKKNINKLFISLVLVLGIIVFIIIFKGIFKVDILEFLKNLFLLKYLPKLDKNTSYALLFAFGVLTSFHCIGMCGGIAISQCVKKNEFESENIKNKFYIWLIPSLLYNLGRVISYTLVGGIVGGLGRVISFSGMFKGVVPIIGGLFMVIMAINLLGIFRILRRVTIRMPSFVARKIYKKNNYSPLIVGLLTGLMPCGPLQIVQLYALGTKSVFFGAVSMFFFSIGTVPLLFTFGAINTIINKKFSKIILKASAVLVLILGIVMIGRGLALYGVSMGMPEMVNKAGKGFSVIQSNNQSVKTEIGPDSFPPVEVVKGLPVKWNIHVNKENLNECNNAIQIPKYKIEKKLVAGDNIVEFTPDEEGEFMYTCWMGMIKSKIIVVNNLDKLKKDQIQDAKNKEESETDKETIQVGKQEFSGLLIDAHCFKLEPEDPGSDTKVCLNMTDCAATGYGIAVKQQDGKYKFYFFDGEFAPNASGAQAQAASIAKNTVKKDHITVDVKGTLKGDMKTYNGVNYQVIIVSSLSEK